MMKLVIFTTVVFGGVLTVAAEPAPVSPHEDIKIRLFYDDADTYTGMTLGKALKMFNHKYYNSSLPVVMVIHGYDQNQNELIQQTVQALFSRKLSEQYNIFAVDLPEQFSFKLMNLYYMRPAMHVPLAGEALGKFFNDAIDRGFITADQINLISFSLGAQVAGYIGRSTNGLIHSISGIDPAGFGFDMSTVVTQLTHVSHSDAKYVHLYHSNSVFMGTSRRLGTADYQFNGGNNQPGCKSLVDPLCSHMRGFLYYHEALRQKQGLPALQCNSLNHLIHCKCHGNRLSYVGFPLDTSAQGGFVLRTLAYPPYSLGDTGVMGFKCKATKAAYSTMMARKYDKIMNLV